MKKILICGYGNIGRHVYDEFRDLKPDIYDPNISEYDNLSAQVYDVAFISVPTDKLPNDKCDLSEVIDATSKVNANVIVLKSAIPPGTAEMLELNTGKNIVVSPEYYGLTQHSKRKLDFVILGGDKKDCAAVAHIYSLVRPGSFRIYFTDFKTAELTKYMLNCFLALKVTYCNEFAKLAKSIGVEYSELRELFILDERVGTSHTFSYPEQPFYNNHCFNKDIPAFIQFAREFGESPKLMETVNEINLIAKKQIGAL